MRIISALNGAGDSDPGLHREVNEDRFHFDVARGLFIVIDGVGGQAAGGKAADTALTLLRTRLERETGPTTERVREAIAIANNEIHRLASLRPEWNGMACVLTIAVVEDGRAIIGHVGDTRLYKIRNNRIEKITRDHSPVGVREDANEISELEAMRHPRRNEVYRDVGSDPHQPADPDFIDLHEIPFETDAALLLCSDGLTDLVRSDSINQLVRRWAGHPFQVVRALIEAANEAGGKDNVTVVYVEGEQFAVRLKPDTTDGAETWRVWLKPDTPRDLETGSRQARAYGRVPSFRWLVRLTILALLTVVIGAALVRMRFLWPVAEPTAFNALTSANGVVLVSPTDSITAALARAQPGFDVIVEPGEYRERLVLRDNVRVRSRVPRGATIRLPGIASEGEAAVVATGVTGAELAGFKIVGDAATPLGTGLLIRDAVLSVVDVEITGALDIAIDIGAGPGAVLIGSDIHDNPGAALTIRSGASPRVVHNVFARNGKSERAVASLVIENGARPELTGNIFQGINPDALATLNAAARAALGRHNWCPGVHDPGPFSPAPSKAPNHPGR